MDWCGDQDRHALVDSIDEASPIPPVYHHVFCGGPKCSCWRQTYQPFSVYRGETEGEPALGIGTLSDFLPFMWCVRIQIPNYHSSPFTCLNSCTRCVFIVWPTTGAHFQRYLRPEVPARYGSVKSCELSREYQSRAKLPLSTAEIFSTLPFSFILSFPACSKKNGPEGKSILTRPIHTQSFQPRDIYPIFYNFSLPPITPIDEAVISPKKTAARVSL